MQLSAKQSIRRYSFTDWKSFIDKILQCPDLISCRSAEESPNNSTKMPSAQPKETAASPKVSDEETQAELMKIFTEAAAFEQKAEYHSELQVLLKGLKIAPEDEGLLIKLGRVYRRLDYPQMALAFYEKAKELYPDSIPLHLNISVLYLTSGRNEEARPYLERALGLYKKNPQSATQEIVAKVYGHYALCLGRLGEMDAAKQNMLKAKEAGYPNIKTLCEWLNIPEP